MRSISVFGIFLVICIVACAGDISTAEDVAEENLQKLALANNELAFNLHRRLSSGSSKNVFFSPLSISTAFGMLFYGTRGKTAEELRKSGDSSDEYVLNSANAILADKNLELIEEYKHKVEELYRAAVRSVDFSREAPKIVTEINEWVNEKTNGKIEKLFNELSADTLLVLLNAVYFKGAWETQFDPKKTRMASFTIMGCNREQRMYR
ncbi:Serpin B8 like protein [Argiope bruennichi]|uniref:Serpin B8 like protein n=1 Tax=Argiope bruennichi TaxID=94029 RepID=A0A8T0EHS7_ARGBR|nr:Serpin B8 like protein [Argiope bruennichi]